MSSLWAAGLLLRRFRMEWGMIAMLFVLIAGTSFVFAGAPRLLNRVYDDALRHELREAPPVQRNVLLAVASSMAPDNDKGISVVRQFGKDLATDLPPSLRGVTDGGSLAITSTRFYVPHPPLIDTYLTLRYQDGITNATRLVGGHWPVAHGVLIPPADGTGLTDGSASSKPASPFVLEAALSQSEATAIGVTVGDRLSVVIDGTDSMLRGIRLDVVPLDIKVVGIYEPLDPNGDYWSADSALKQVTPAGSPEHPVAYATAYIPPESYPSLWNTGMPFHYEWLYRVDPQRVDAGALPRLLDDLHRMTIVRGTSELASPGTPVMRTGLDAILADFAAQTARSDSVLAIAAIGPFGLASAAVGMVALLLVMRRRTTLALARGRGASGSLLIGTQLWEAILIAGAASVAGWLTATALIPARASPASLLFALAVGVAAVLLLVAASWSTAQRPLGQLERDDPPVLRVAPRRLVVEMTVVAIALAAVALLRQRGLTIEAAGKPAQFDPLLAAAPVLSGVAVGIVATRLYPLPIRGFGWLAARRRDLVPVLGLRRIGRNPSAANLPLLVLLLTAAFGAFASVVVASLDRGQGVASYQAVGADYRLERIGIGSLPTLDPKAIPGVQAAASGTVDGSAQLSSTPNQRAPIRFEAVDAGPYRAVVAGTPVDASWPGGFADAPPVSGAGTPQHPIPVILSWEVPAGTASLNPGDTFQITVIAKTLSFRLVDRWDRFAGMGDQPEFALAPYAWLKAAFGKSVPLPSVMWLRGGPEVAKPLAAAIDKAGGSVHVTSRHDVLLGLSDSPLAVAIVIAFEVALVVAAAYLALTVIGSLVLSAARRTQDLAYLRVLGVTGPQALGLTIVENAPPVLVAVIPGVALGIGIAYLIEPGLGLDTFIGAANTPLFVDWQAVAVLVAALIAVFALAVAAGTWLSRRARLVNALRMGDD